MLPVSQRLGDAPGF